MKKLASNSTWKKLTLAPGPTTLWQTEAEIVEAVGDFFYWGASKSLQMLTAAIKVKDTCTLERKPWETQKAYLKAETSLCRQRPYSESYGLPSSHVLGSVSESWWRRQWHPTPVLSPEKSHGRRSLVACSPWGRTESGLEQLSSSNSKECKGMPLSWKNFWTFPSTYSLGVGWGENCWNHFLLK